MWLHTYVYRYICDTAFEFQIIEMCVVIMLIYWFIWVQKYWILCIVIFLMMVKYNLNMQSAYTFILYTEGQNFQSKIKDNDNDTDINRKLKKI